MDTPTPSPTSPASPVRTRLIPLDQNDLADLLTRVAKSYASAPAKFVLDWKTPAEATQLAADLTAAVDARTSQTAARQASSGRLELLTSEMDKGATQVKAMINEEWENDAEAESHYPEFGLEGSNHVLPRAQGVRVAAIENQLLPALLKYGMGGRKYGTSWWQPRLAEYETLTGQRQDNTQEISGTVGEKAPLLTEARDFLGRLDSLVYANTRTRAAYLAERRVLGFLKEYN